MARASVLAPLSAAGELPHSLQSVVSWKFSVKPPAEPTPTRKAPRTPLLDGFDTPLSRPRRRNQESRGEASLKHTQFMTSLASGHLDPLTMVSSGARVLRWLQRRGCVAVWLCGCVRVWLWLLLCGCGWLP